MKKEIRVYLADLNDWYSSSTELDNVMECAESQGTVWSLPEMIEQFNDGEECICSLLSDTTGNIVMKSALFGNGKFIREIKRNNK